MIYNALMSVFRSRGLIEKTAVLRSSRSKYINEKYQERSITNRYFK